jgi:hypothetical protein
MVWGAAGPGYKSDIFFSDGTLNGQGSIDYLIDNSMFEEMEKAFEDSVFDVQQDDASPDTTEKTKKCSEIEAQINLIPDWRANSSDLSVIENVGLMMKLAIAPCDPKSIDELKRILKEE